MKKVERHIWDRMLAKDYHLRENVNRKDSLSPAPTGEVIWAVKHGATGEMLGEVKARSWYDARQQARIKWDEIVKVEPK